MIFMCYILLVFKEVKIMLKTFTTSCPTKDKKVTVVVDYIPANCLESKSIYIKGRICSCSGNPSGCNTCKLYEKLPQQI